MRPYEMHAVAVVAVALLASRCAGADEVGLAEATVDIGKQVMAVPFPEGFVRIDRVSGPFDEATAGFLPPTNRLLIHLGTKADRAALAGGVIPDVQRSFNVQVQRDLEGENLSPADFLAIVRRTKRDLADLKVKEDLNREFDETAAPGGGPTTAAGEGGRGPAATRGVGLLDEGDNFLSFGMEIDAGAGAEAGYVLVTMLRLHGKVVYLYANAARGTAENREWARGAMASWRGAMLAGNEALATVMASVPSSGGRAGGAGVIGRLLNYGLVGAVAGALVALAVVMLKKTRR